jgi:hypothetical protein
MKKITLFLLSIVVGVAVNAQTTMSHSIDQTIATGLVACSNGGGGYSTENSYWRTYVPNDYGLAGTIDLQSVDFALSFTDSGGTNPTMDITVKLHTTDAAFPGGTLTEIASKTIQVTVADHLQLMTVAFDAPLPQVDGAAEVVVEVNMEDGETDVVDFRIAGNNLGEDAPGYISADSCSIGDPVTYSSIGFDDSHMIINLIGAVTGAGIADNVINGFNMYPNPVKDVLVLKAAVNIDAVSIYNMLGQEVIKTTQSTIDMSAVPSGSYIVKVGAGNQVASYNFIKQ